MSVVNSSGTARILDMNYYSHNKPTVATTQRPEWICLHSLTLLWLENTRKRKCIRETRKFGFILTTSVLFKLQPGQAHMQDNAC